MAESKHPDLTTFKALRYRICRLSRHLGCRSELRALTRHNSFDCYGTLIDWETGIYKSLSYLTSQLPKDHPLNQDPPTKATARFNEISIALEKAQPTLLYNENLVETTAKLAAELDIAAPDSLTEPMGNAPGTWGPFPDTMAALAKLRKHYSRLMILSNIDNTNMASTVTTQLAGVKFDATYTAQDIGNYKPHHANFQYLFGHARHDFGIDADKGDLLHVARSIRADHVPAKELGLRSVWISRGGQKEGMEGAGDAEKDNVAFEWRFDTLGEFADEVERQFGAKEGK
jgi:2-haloalkanoic acid dehalogenase type II